jgi:hypothetical protein
MTRAQRRANRARRMSPRWRREHPGEVPAGFRSAAGRKIDSFVPVWRRRNREALAIQFLLTTWYGVDDYPAADFVALIASSKPLTATSIEAMGRAFIKLSGVTERHVLVSSYSDRIVRGLREILDRGRLDELGWLLEAAFGVRKLFEAARNGGPNAGQWAAMLDASGWRPFMRQAADRWTKAMRSNFPPDPDPPTRKLMLFADFLASEIAAVQRLNPGN